MPSALILTRVHLGARKEATEAELKTEFSLEPESQSHPPKEGGLAPEFLGDHSKSRKAKKVPGDLLRPH